MPNYGCIFTSVCQFSQQPSCKENESYSKADTVRQKEPSQVQLQNWQVQLENDFTGLLLILQSCCLCCIVVCKCQDFDVKSSVL